MTRTINEKEVSLVTQSVELIEEKIIDGTFQPGIKLKIDYLSKLFNVGHSPIREALSRLVATGLVNAEENKGFRVTPISEADIRDLYHSSLLIELLILKEAMQKGDDSWEAGIVASLYHLGLVETKKSGIDFKTWAERNTAFHQALIFGCKSHYLIEIRNDLFRRLDRYSRLSFKLAQRELHVNHEEHKEIAAAVIARDQKKVKDLVTYHMLGSLEDVIKTLKQSNML